jgi:transcriptional regulator with XRE-family HTH domain
VDSEELDDASVSLPSSLAERRGIGSALAKLRRQKGLTGHDLGQRAGMSQAKISKIETGAVVPTANDAERIARALGASPEMVRALREQAEGLHDQFTDLRVTSRRLTSSQQEVGGNESRARVIRVFQPAIVVGLLQTAEYARSVLGDFAAGMSGASVGVDASAVPAAVTARVKRQEILVDRRKRFEFVMSETVFHNQICSASAMVAQLDRIREIAGYPNVTIAVLPPDASLAFPPMHGFEMFDGRLVLIDLINTVMTSRGAADLRMYRSVFDHFLASSTTDIDPILHRYVDRYADLARTARG